MKERRNGTEKERYSGGEHGKGRKSERRGGGRKMVPTIIVVGGKLNYGIAWMLHGSDSGWG